MKARWFPRITKATPDDDFALNRKSCPTWLTIPEGISEIDVSVCFSWDRECAEQFADDIVKNRNDIRVNVGGRAYRDKGGDFVAGKYIKRGYVITSRGCPNRCWFCDAWKIEGGLRELPIQDGFNILDNNLLACSRGHINAVFDMLRRQPERPVFSGGLEAKILEDWHCDLLRSAKTKRMYFAYDTPDDLAPLIDAGNKLRRAGFTNTSKTMCCYVLIGYRGDTFDAAETRLKQAIVAGFTPYAMLYRDETGRVPSIEWSHFQTHWLKPEIVNTECQKLWKNQGGII